VFIAKISNLPGVAYSRNGADLWIFGSQLAANQQVKPTDSKHTFASFTRASRYVDVSNFLVVINSIDGRY
jgi:hypothetical protein